MDILLRLGGILLILAVLQDLFFTVLFPASGHGMLRNVLVYGLCHIFRLLGRLTVGQRRRNLLAYTGPVIISATLVMWFFLLLIGWAMIYKPALGTGVGSQTGPSDLSWATAIYFSGFNLTTLGVGDVVAKTGAYRVLSVVQAFTGFAVLSMTLTYFLSVYSQLTDRNAFAQALHHRTGNTGDAARFIARLAEDSQLPGARENLSSMAGSLRQIYQSHHLYPVLRNFHYRDSFYALPRILLVVLETAALVRTAPDKQEYKHVDQSVALDELLAAGTALLDELAPDIKPKPPDEQSRKLWEERYRNAVRCFRQAGLTVNADTEAGVAQYIEFRSEWEEPLRHIADTMLYNWEEIEMEQAS